MSILSIAAGLAQLLLAAGFVPTKGTVSRVYPPNMADTVETAVTPIPSNHPLLDTASTNRAPLVRTATARAGITRHQGTFDDWSARASDTTDHDSHRVRHAAVGAGIGAGVGLVVGAAVGLFMDSNPGDGFIPATPITAVIGTGIGLISGLVTGALFR
jgi:hypothetical protein